MSSWQNGWKGPIPAPADFSYVWGDALDELRCAAPQARIINLETSVTRSRDYAPKGINYKMNPENIACLTAAGVDCCVLANNHVLDFSEAGLCETLDALEQAGIRLSGASRDLAEGQAPTVIEVTNAGRVLVFAFGCGSSGIPLDWAAGRDRPGVNLLPDLSNRMLESISQLTQGSRQQGDARSLARRWFRPNQEKVRSTTQRRGTTTKPLMYSLRLTISMRSSGTLCHRSANLPRVVAPIDSDEFEPGGTPAYLVEDQRGPVAVRCRATRFSVRL